MSLTPRTFLASRGVSDGFLSHVYKRQATIDETTPSCVTNLKCDYINNLKWTCEGENENCVLFCDAFESGDYIRESIKCVQAACSEDNDADMYVSQMSGVVGELSALCSASAPSGNQKRAEEEEPTEATTPPPTTVNEFIPSATSAICHEEPIEGEYDPENPSLNAVNSDCACIVSTGTPGGLSSNGTAPISPPPSDGAGSSIRMGGLKGSLVAAVLFGSLFSGLLI
ncbi:hypothetical protein BJ508DRAFT_118459 [Ascobolus immersus RN42]|uniref:Uncharacterized protein n=1 Tax=Ascobolus immersus RN42 TaxID=1160509 RepID=A0A3N4I6D5_ASCIM|nr:hypothetical protein BJ508DRAFT_118459 [Ascobolus immersus RN42]